MVERVTPACSRSGSARDQNRSSPRVRSRSLMIVRSRAPKERARPRVDRDEGLVLRRPRPTARDSCSNRRDERRPSVRRGLGARDGVRFHRPSGRKSISTVVEPGAMSTSSRSQPYVNTLRRSASSSTKDPITLSPLTWVQRSAPPARASISTTGAIHSIRSSASVSSSYTRAGGAAMNSRRSTSFTPFALADAAAGSFRP